MDENQDAVANRGRGPGRWKRRLIALALGLGIPLIVGEVVVRLTEGAPLVERLPIVEIQANRLRGWEMIPSQTHYTYLNPVHINALGLRGDEIEAKPAGQRRLLALGDSLIYGQGVGDQETLPAYLENVLNDTDTEGSWDVVNAGHRAYDTRQELGLLEELGAAIEPDTVVLFWFWNDIHERDIDETCERLEESGPIYFDTGDQLKGSDLWRWKGKQLLRRSALVMALWDLFSPKQAQPTDEAYVDAAFARLDVYLDSFLKKSEQEGFEFWFAPIPDSGDLQGHTPATDLLERAVSVARDKGIPVIDLLPGLRALAKGQGRLPVIPFDGHYLPAANAVMGTEVAEAILAE